MKVLSSPLSSSISSFLFIKRTPLQTLTATMESLKITRRRGYLRIDSGCEGSRRRGRFWRIKITPRLVVLREASPRKILERIRDAYVRMMLSLSGAFSLGVAYAAYGYAPPPPPPPKEYDEKVLVEIYKSIIAASEHGAPGPAIALRR